MYDFYITLLKEVVGLGRHSYDEATELMSRAGLVEHELELRPILEEALDRCAEQSPMVVSVIRSRVAERHVEAVRVEHGISDSKITRPQDVEPNVPLERNERGDLNPSNYLSEAEIDALRTEDSEQYALSY